MATNLATKYSDKIAERFHKKSLTNAAAGKEFSFAGAKTVVLTSVNVVSLRDFDREANGNRFGPIENLGDTTQEATMTQDKAFAFAIDAGDSSDQAIDNSAGRALRRELDEVVVPTIDKYRLSKWAQGAGVKKYSGSNTALTKTTILPAIIATGAEMSNALVPVSGRVLFIPTRNYIHLVQADAVIDLQSTGNRAVEEGVVGMLDGNKVVPVPDGWFPEGVEFLIKYKSCTADPVKLQNYHIHQSPQGFDGPVVEGRVYYDSFVLKAREAGIGIYCLGSKPAEE